MKLMLTGLAAALTVATLALPATGMAQGMSHDAMQNSDMHRGDHDGARHDDRARHDDNRWNNGRHNGWNNHRRHRACNWTWRHHHRVRVCHWR